MVNRDAPDAIDTRDVLHVYAWLAGIGGLIVAAWGQSWFGTEPLGAPFGREALARVFGTIVAGTGLCAAGLASVEDPASRHRALGWFTLGHGVVTLMVSLQWKAIWGDPSLPFRIVLALLFASVLVLAYFWVTGHRRSSDGVRSTYEQQIRDAAGQEERNRLARDLHDSIKQQIFVIQTAAATAQARFDDDRIGARDALAQVRTAAREAIAEMEAMLDQLRAVPLETVGLVGSLKKQCEALGHRTGAEVTFELGTLPPTDRLAPGAHMAIFRLAQEALANIGRHARARRVRVALDADTESVTLVVEDDGAGFAPVAEPAAGLGIGNMRARAAEFGGSLAIDSGPDAGTRVRLSIPMLAQYDAAECRGRVVRAGAGLAFIVAISIWDVVHGGAGYHIPVFVTVTVYYAVVFGHAMIAYRRVRRPQATP